MPGSDIRKELLRYTVIKIYNSEGVVFMRLPHEGFRSRSLYLGSLVPYKFFSCFFDKNLVKVLILPRSLSLTCGVLGCLESTSTTIFSFFSTKSGGYLREKISGHALPAFFSRYPGMTSDPPSMLIILSMMICCSVFCCKRPPLIYLKAKRNGPVKIFSYFFLSGLTLSNSCSMTPTFHFHR